MKPLILASLIGATVAGCATTPTGRSQLMIVSPDSAIVESQKAYASTVGELDQNNQLLTDPSWVKRISDITGRLVTEAIKLQPETKNWEWSVAIIDDPNTLNAWCMAGGRMAIYSGIVTQLNLTDDEIAQIMGHEISHALANHTAERMSRAVVLNAGLLAAGAVTDNNGMVLTGTAMAAKLALELPNSRTAESEADEIGIKLATLAGYKPDAAVSLWNKMQKAGGGGGPEFLSTHPSPGNRAKTLGKLGGDMLALNPQLKKSAVYPITIVTDAAQAQ
ncbi:M48 family metallopeptidase [uncultured Thalassolituus sp.]|uniref:M48 family metallopeptidase n=1 Tax=uncultured Thalassolituus sp. TaxID=285273 RepID=UPI00261EC447|nr:M48 family metallopeptidase [uncultured Thalassolituus sp.]